MEEGTKKDILIIGADSMLGQVLFKEAAHLYSVEGTALSDLDMTDKKKVMETCRKIHPKTIVLLAAYTDVDGCEEKPDVAHKINVLGTKNVAEAAKEINAVLLFMSSDYVFDGRAKMPYREDDEIRPISVYGQSKADGEKIVANTVEKFVVIRSSWLFGDGKKGFVQAILEAIRQKRPLRVVADKTGSPTYVVDLASAIVKLIGLILKGEYDFQKNSIVHITNQGVCSWFDMAQYMVRCLKTDGVSVSEIKLSDYSFKAKRPQHSALNSGRYKAITGAYLRPWQEALGEFIRTSDAKYKN